MLEPVTWRNHAAVASAALGDLAGARGLAQDAAELARSGGRPEQLAAALLTRAIITGGRDSAGLAEAVALFHAIPSAEFGVPCPRTGAGLSAHGVAHLRSAGHSVLAHQLEQLIALPRSHPKPLPVAGTELLNPHECRLIALAIDGLTNAQMAAGLRVSRRAVEFHFTRIYRKLGITRRAQLHSAVAGFRADNPALFGAHAAVAPTPRASSTGRSARMA